MSDPIEVLAVPRELLIAASGRPITVSTPDGTEVVLRIPTAEEFREANRRGREMVAGLGVDPPPPASDALIADIIKPLPIWEDV